MQAVIFDLDGTLLDSRRAFYAQFQELASIYDNAELSKETIDAAAHGTTEQIVRKLIKDTSTPLDEILETHRKLRIQACEKHLTLYRGVQDLLGNLTARGLKVGALTSGNHLTVNWLARLKVDHHFSDIVSAEHVQNPKPHPEGLILAMNNLNVTPEQTIMIGDTVVDIQVGKNAKIYKTIGLTHGFGKQVDLEKAGADHIAPNLAAILDMIE